jgi:hypothetical protein
MWLLRFTSISTSPPSVRSSAHAHGRHRQRADDPVVQRPLRQATGTEPVQWNGTVLGNSGEQRTKSHGWHPRPDAGLGRVVLPRHRIVAADTSASNVNQIRAADSSSSGSPAPPVAWAA